MHRYVVSLILLAAIHASQARAVDSPCGDFVRLENTVLDPPAQRIVDAGSCLAAIHAESGLSLLDVSDPLNPVVCGSLPGVLGWQLTVAGDLLLVTTQSPGLSMSIVDISDPSQPVLLSTTPTLTNPSEIAVIGDEAFVCVTEYGPWGGVEPHGVERFDISDPAAPVSLGLINDRWARSILAAGNYLYIGLDIYGVEIYEVGVAPDPVLVASIGGFDAVELFHDEGTLYVGRYGINRLVTMDVRDPTAPQIVDEQDLGYVTGLRFSGDGSKLLAAWDATLELYDITDPHLPATVLRSEARTIPYSVVVRWPYAWLSTDSSGLQIYDLSSRQVPGPENVHWENENSLRGMQRSGDHIVIADRTPAIRVLDVPPTGPASELGSYPISFEIDALLVDGTRAYVGAREPGVTILDLTDPASPTLLGTVPTPTSPYRMGLSGDHLLILDYYDLAYVADVSDPATASVVTSFTPSGNVLAMDASGDLACLAMVEGLEILDLSDPALPMSRGTWSSPDDYFTNVLIEGSLAFLAGKDGEYLYILDISDPDAPTEVGTMYIGAKRTPELTFASGHLFLHTDWGIMVLDVRDPSSPRTVTQGVGSRGLRDILRLDDRVITMSSLGATVSSVFLACDPGVPVILQDFTARVVQDRIQLDWMCSVLDPLDLRLVATHGVSTTDLQIESSGDGNYSASEPIRGRSGQIDFTLFMRDDDGWRVLRHSTVELNARVRTALLNVSPNPFNPLTTIEFALAASGPIRISVYDLSGRRVRVLSTESWPAGRHSLRWDGLDDAGRSVASGSYLIRLESGDSIDTRKAVLLR